MSFKNYSKLEMLQNEYQWWSERRMTAINEGDIEYRKECDDVMSKLLKDIRSEYNKPKPAVVKDIKRRTFIDKVRNIFNI
jgi:hypothetical protein